MDNTVIIGLHHRLHTSTGLSECDATHRICFTSGSNQIRSTQLSSFCHMDIVSRQVQVSLSHRFYGNQSGVAVLEGSTPTT